MYSIGINLLPSIYVITIHTYKCPACGRVMTMQPAIDGKLSISKKCRHIVGIIIDEKGSPLLAMPSVKRRKGKRNVLKNNS